MKIFLALCLAAVAFTGFGSDLTTSKAAQDSVPMVNASVGTKAPGPKIEFATPIYDFGRVVAGELVKHSFVFTNVGDEVLEVTKVEPSCGCTIADQWTRNVMPGETGTVPLQMHTLYLNGEVLKNISVTSNDKQKPVTALQLKGTVWKAVEFIPANLVLNVTADSTNTSASIRIINNMEEPLTLSDPQMNSDAFAVSLATIKAGKEYQLTVTSVRALDPGNIVGKVTFRTESTKIPKVEVPFWGYVQPVVTVFPSQIVLPHSLSGKNNSMSVTIQNNSTNALTLSNPVVNLEGVDVQIKDVRPGRTYRAVLTFPDGFEMPAKQLAALTMKSSHAKLPEIRVPIVQQAPSISTPSKPSSEVVPKASTNSTGIR